MSSFHLYNDNIMKKLLFLCLFMFGMMNVYAIHPLVSELDSMFVSGELFPLIEQVKQLRADPSDLSEVDKSIAYTYELLASYEMGIPVDLAKKQEALKYSEQAFGAESRNYALALIPSDTYDKRTYNDIEKAIGLLKTSCGESSWEYAYAQARKVGCMMMLGKSREGIGQSGQAIALFEKYGYGKGWMCAKGYSMRACLKVMNQDGSCFEDMEKAIDITNAMGDRGLCPSVEIFAHSVFVCTNSGMFAEAIKMGTDLMSIMDTLKLQGTVSYAANMQNLAIAYYMNGEKQKALDGLSACKKIYESLNMTGDTRYKQVISSIKDINK